MDPEKFRFYALEVANLISNYHASLPKRRVTPDVEPGYLERMLPAEPPMQPEPFGKILEDFETKILPGITHWQHPRFHAYFPSGCSYPSVLGSMLGDAIGCIGFSWASSPAQAELEIVMMDWLGMMLGLPKEMLFKTPNSTGGGVIQTGASEAILDCILAARTNAIHKLMAKDGLKEHEALPKLMAYCSTESHSSVEKGAMVAMVKLRILKPNEQGSLTGEILRTAMEEDTRDGYVPFFVSSTIGSTGICAFDKLEELAPVCKEFDAWFHVDGAYAGNMLICPELRVHAKGLELADSFNCNANKWMLMNFDCAFMWVRDRYKLTKALAVDPLYLTHTHEDVAVDFRHWGIPLSRRFRALKVWFTIRTYGVAGLQHYIREHIRLAKRFEYLVRRDDFFEAVGEVRTGLVCFKVKGALPEANELTKKLLQDINDSGDLHMVPTEFNNQYVIRFCVCAPNAKDADINRAWDIIAYYAKHLNDPNHPKLRHRYFVDEVSDVHNYNHKVVPFETLATLEKDDNVVKTTDHHEHYDAWRPLNIIGLPGIDNTEESYVSHPFGYIPDLSVPDQN